MIAFECPQYVQEAVRSLVSCQPTKSGWLVTTSCLYPDGSAVQVDVREADGGYYVTDSGRALLQVRISGHQSKKPGYHIAGAANEMGAAYSRGMIYMTGIPPQSLPIAISIVSSASASGVSRTLANFDMPNVRNFHYAFDTFIRDRFSNQFKRELLIGASEKVYTLDYVHKDGQLIVLDPIQPDEMSVARAIATHIDLRAANDHPDHQVLIFDGNDPWTDSNLRRVKSIAVEVVEYEQAQTYIPTLIAA